MSIMGSGISMSIVFIRLMNSVENYIDELCSRLDFPVLLKSDIESLIIPQVWSLITVFDNHDKIGLNLLKLSSLACISNSYILYNLQQMFDSKILLL